MNIKNFLVKAALSSSALALCLGLSSVPAQAEVVITPAGPGFVATSDTTSNAALLLEWAAYVGDPASELYKQNVSEGFDTGALAGSYATTFSNTPGDPSEALIDYISGPSLNCAIDCYLIVKDGNNSPAAYLFNLKGIWDGIEDLRLTGFWPGTGAISHVAFYGGQGTVPEPTSLALVGLALLAAGVARRRSR